MGQRRWLTVLVAASCLGAVPAAAQRMWEPEIGIRGGWTHAKFDQPGNNTADFLDLPGAAPNLGSLSGRAPLFAVIPVGARLAISPEVGMADVSVGLGGGTTFWELGTTLDYAFTPHIYAGAGATFSFVRIGTTENAGGGYQAKAGYRIMAGRALRLRLEAFYNGRPKSNLLPKVDLYGISLGVSTRIK